MKNPNKLQLGAALIVACLASLGQSWAHCDGMDGPVVKAAELALAEKNVNPVLIWVQHENENEIKEAFKKTLAVRELSGEARELADRYFFETLVRVHRAGEGEPYTGLKPAGRDPGPAIAAADKSLKEGKIDPVQHLISSTVEKCLEHRFAEARKKMNFAKDDVEAGREFVKAYVEYIHCVEGLYRTASHSEHAHPGEEPKQAEPHAHE